MEDNMQKQQILIEVDPNMAVFTIGLLRGFLPSIVGMMKKGLLNAGGDVLLKDGFEEEMTAVLNEVYEKCIQQTNVREKAANLTEVLEMTGQFPDDTKNC